MRIGILTFHYCHNYGAMLQAYALHVAINNIGHVPLFVNYRLPHLYKRYTFFKLYLYKGMRNKIHNIRLTLMHPWQRWLYIKRFKDFEKNYFQLVEVENVNCLDIIIVGSDQVWNPKITGGYDDFYYGDLSKKGIPHISYAASCPADLLRPHDERLLKNFKALGVRENPMLNKLKTEGYNASLTLDPTLLISASDYECILGKRRFVKYKYVFVYNLSAGDGAFLVAMNAANTFNARIISNLYTKKYPIDYCYRDAGPKQFLNMIKYAEFCVVSSFHGVVFSIIFHKNFIYYPFGNEKDERACSLLKSLDLEQRIKDENVDLSTLSQINWDCVEMKIKKMRNESIHYLYENINTIVS